ncbi:MAG: hypothetical protein [Caudoviricetes sp.]|nr:MAG: hypothetical protein [Caudoviricetes sp.]
MIKEGSIVEYVGLDGYKKIGKVSYLYTSVMGFKCASLTNGENMVISKLKYIKV